MLPTVAVYASVAVMLLHMLLDTFAVKIKYVVSARVSEDKSKSKQALQKPLQIPSQI